MDIMENQNLIVQVPVPPPIDEAALTHTWVIQAIQDDVLGYFSMEEKEKIIYYIINNPSAATSYEVLNDKLFCATPKWFGVEHDHYRE